MKSAKEVGRNQQVWSIGGGTNTHTPIPTNTNSVKGKRSLCDGGMDPRPMGRRQGAPTQGTQGRSRQGRRGPGGLCTGHRGSHCPAPQAKGGRAIRRVMAPAGLRWAWARGTLSSSNSPWARTPWVRQRPLSQWRPDTPIGMISRIGSPREARRVGEVVELP